MKKISFSAVESIVRAIIDQEIQPKKLHDENKKILMALAYLEKRLDRIEKIFTDTLQFVTEVMENVSNK